VIGQFEAFYNRSKPSFGWALFAAPAYLALAFRIQCKTHYRWARGTGAKGEMGEGSEGIATSSGDSQNNESSYCEAHHVNFSLQEDRGVSSGQGGRN
jgi:hypothetical protein